MPGTRPTVEVNGWALRELRDRSGLDVRQLAAEVGVQRPFIVKLELGHSRRVSPPVFAKIVAALGCDRRAIMANPHALADAVVEATAAGVA